MIVLIPLDEAAGNGGARAVLAGLGAALTIEGDDVAAVLRL
ncbi:hypothetical protein [Amycolatopsis sp. SID8362]|nr:hypothetical protein [Amycolatopsis sp. SID8362]